ncbi:MAG TPA: hypothetical protein VJT16_18225 [Streptosporangiaceae bacterium]|nr:hypothetical protein [Streptosporangiaceae bacterium]
MIPRNLGESQHSSRAAGRHASAEPVGPLPDNVRTSARLLYAGAVLNVIGVVYYGLTTSPSSGPQLIHVDNPHSSSYAIGAALGGIFAAAVIAGVWLWMAWAIKRAKNWARIVSAVLLGIGAFGLVGRLVLMPVTVVTLSWALCWLAGLGAVILMFQRSVSAFFAPADTMPQAPAYPGAPGIQAGYGYPQPGQAPGYPWQDQGQWTQPAAPTSGSTFPAPSAPDRQQPKRRHTGLIIGASAVAAIVIIAVGLLAATGHLGSSGARTDADTSQPTESHTIALPRTAAGYDRMTGNVGERIVAAVRRRAQKEGANGGGPWVSAYTEAPIGVYSRAGASPVLFIGFSVDRTPQIASILQAQSPGPGADSFLLGAGVSSTQDFPAGSLGGVLRCGRSRNSLIYCVWQDSSVLAMLAEGNTTASKLAHVALAFREAAEH